MDLLQTLMSFLVAIVILVTIHEFGHFYVARLCGVKVLRFSLGFGKVLWRRVDKWGTEFTLSALPFGGYVKMLDEREEPVPDELRSQAFNQKTAWQRIAIVLAGPVANFILAILLFWVLLLPGERGLIPVVGNVEKGSLAAQAGFEVGQEIVEVDGEPTPTEQFLGKALLNRLGETGSLDVKVKYPNSDLKYELHVSLDRWMQGVKDPDPFKGLGLELAYPLQPIVGELSPEGAAQKAGFKPDDLIVRVDQTPITDWRDWVRYVHDRPGQTIEVGILRDNLPLTLTVVPETLKTSEFFWNRAVSYGRVGMMLKPAPETLFRHYDYSVTGALVAGIKKTWDTSGFVLLSVKKLIFGEISTKNLSGPISIAKVAGSSAQQGMKSFFGFVALLSVFLGVFNLLPIPVLDGGHLVYLVVELIKGKPVSEKIQIMAYQMGLALVLSLSALAMYNDIMRL